MARLIFEIANKVVTPEATSDFMHRSILRVIHNMLASKLKPIVCGIHKKEPTLTVKAASWEEMHSDHLRHYELKCCCTTVRNRCMRVIER